MTGHDTTPRICVVDDDAAVGRAVATLLDACGHACRVFDSGEALLAWPRLAEFELGVFDVDLPGIDGFALRAQLALLRPHLPLIYITGLTDPGIHLRAQAAGALALLPKPLDPDALLAQVERALTPGAPA